ncbi:MAG: prefoldin subunit alpha [Candidatus Micrarchaeota archaeon]|nr:prefoldin subunit alpha [Candidatus Micrarchaeota archaeon]
MASKQEEFEQLKYLYDAYTREYEAVVGEISNYMMAASAFDRNLQVFDNIDKLQNANMLVGLEGGTYLQTSTKEVKSVITSVGAGYLVEKKVEDAKQMVSANHEKLQKNMKQLIEQRQKLEKEIMDITSKINSLQQTQ